MVQDGYFMGKEPLLNKWLYWKKAALKGGLRQENETYQYA
jgi:hypothetical protein